MTMEDSLRLRVVIFNLGIITTLTGLILVPKQEKTTTMQSLSKGFQQKALLLMSISALSLHVFLVTEKWNGRDHLDSLSKEFFADLRENIKGDEEKLRSFDEFMEEANDPSKRSGLPPFVKLLLRGTANTSSNVSRLDTLADEKTRQGLDKEMDVDRLRERYDVVSETFQSSLENSTTGLPSKDGHSQSNVSIWGHKMFHHVSDFDLKLLPSSKHKAE